MGHNIPVTDDTYEAISAIAASQGATADVLIAQWLAEKLEDERHAAQVDAAFENDEEWVSGAREAMENHKQGHVYQTLEEFFVALGADETHLEAARKLDRGDVDADL